MTHIPTVREQHLDRRVTELMRQRDDLVDALREVLPLAERFLAGHRRFDTCRAASQLIAGFDNDAQTSSALTRTNESGHKGVTAGETALQALCEKWRHPCASLSRYECADDLETAIRLLDECRHHVADGDHCPDCEAMKE